MTADPPTVVILSGGLATRLRPLTNNIPKCLVNCHGKPFLHHQLALLRRQGITNVLLCVHHLSQHIHRYLADSPPQGQRITVIDDGEIRQGTAGAIRQALSVLPPIFLVLYGDSYVLEPLADIWRAFQQQAKPAMMTVYHNAIGSDNSNIRYNRGEILRYDKGRRDHRMTHIDYGVGIFHRQAFEQSRHAELDALYRTLLQHQQLGNYLAKQPYFEIGSFQGLDCFNRYLAHHHVLS